LLYQIFGLLLSSIVAGAAVSVNSVSVSLCGIARCAGGNSARQWSAL